MNPSCYYLPIWILGILFGVAAGVKVKFWPTKVGAPKSEKRSPDLADAAGVALVVYSLCSQKNCISYLEKSNLSNFD